MLFRSFVDSRHPPGYWRTCAARQVARMHYRIRELAQRGQQFHLIGAGALPAFVERQTQQRPIEQGGPTRDLAECDAVWSFKILEGLKAWLYRDAKRQGLDARALLA